MQFKELAIKPELLIALEQLKLDKPTEVQEKSIPILLSRKDAIVRSKTGSGKTFAFLLPLLTNLTHEQVLQAVILAPTRELAVQTDKEIRKLDKSARSVLLYGGVAIGPQIDQLDRGAQIAVATPGRVLDHLERKTIDFSHVSMVVLDEADRMLDMGFIDDVERILRAMPTGKQMILFSATMPDKVQELSSRYMNNPEFLMLQQDEITVKKIRQQVLGVDRKQKLDLLFKILSEKEVEKMMIFVNTKDWAKMLGDILYRRRLPSTSIHSGLSQNKRNQVIMDFNRGKFKILVATDVAARGLHIEDVTHVVNYDIPRNPKDYVHRIGRTGRAGKEGDAITFITQQDESMLRGVEQEIKMFLEVQYVGMNGAPLARPAPPAQKDMDEATAAAMPVAHQLHPGETIKVHSHKPESASTGDDWGLD